MKKIIVLISVIMAVVCITACFADNLTDPKTIAVGDTVTFGNYAQDNDQSNGKEPIEWIVLDVHDGKALLLIKYGLSEAGWNKYSYISVEFANQVICTNRDGQKHQVKPIAIAQPAPQPEAATTTDEKNKVEGEKNKSEEQAKKQETVKKEEKKENTPKKEEKAKPKDTPKKDTQPKKDDKAKANETTNKDNNSKKDNTPKKDNKPKSTDKTSKGKKS